METLPLFFKNPRREFYVREVSRLLHIGPTTASKKLYELAKKGMLRKKESANSIFYFANIENKDFIIRKRIYNIESLYNSGLVEYLITNYNHPKAIVLFGSYSRGEDDERSDIDIAIFTKKKISHTVDAFQRIVQRNIHIFELSQDKLTKELKMSLINGIILYGYLEV